MAKILEFKKKDLENVLPIDLIVSLPSLVAGYKVSKALLKDIAKAHNMGPITLLGCELVGVTSGFAAYSNCRVIVTAIRSEVVKIINTLNNLDEEVEDDGRSET